MGSGHEVETKVLDIDPREVRNKLEKLGAEKILETRLAVDWYWTKGTKEGQEPWFLRIRSGSDGAHEVTWKAKSDILGTARKHQEINLKLENPEKLAQIFLEIGLERYAHQEKDRVSYKYKEWHFDIDQYPEMPAYLEIEGRDENHVLEAIKLLGLAGNKTWAEGERTLIQKVYGLDWYQMKFS